MPLNTKGFKDTATHDFMFKTSQADADSLPVSMKIVVLITHYIRVYFLNYSQLRLLCENNGDTVQSGPDAYTPKQCKVIYVGNI